jgi:hypothetical protein
MAARAGRTAAATSTPALSLVDSASTDEEVTNDYATSTAEAAFTMTCACGSPLCRGVVRGDDWRRAELRRRYGTHWVPAVLALIRASDK